MGSTPADDKYLLSPEEQDQSGSSVRFLAGVELSHNGGKESVKYCKACISEAAHKTLQGATRLLLCCLQGVTPSFQSPPLAEWTGEMS